jgi:hypothetical protein
VTTWRKRKDKKRGRKIGGQRCSKGIVEDERIVRKVKKRTELANRAHRRHVEDKESKARDVNKR